MSKYWERYRERYKSCSNGPTNKEIFSSSFEPQIDRTPLSKTPVHSLPETIDYLKAQLNETDEKLKNLTKLVKLQQSFSESQEQEIFYLKKQIEDTMKSPRPKGRTDNQLFQLGNRIASLEDQLGYNPKLKIETFKKEIELTLERAEEKIKKIVKKAREEIETKQCGFQNKIEQTTRKLNMKLDSAVPCFGRPAELEESFSESASVPASLLSRLKSLEAFQVTISKEFEVKSSEIAQVLELTMKLSQGVKAKERTSTELEDRISNRIAGALEKMTGIMNSYTTKFESLSTGYNTLQRRLNEIRPEQKTIKASKSSTLLNARDQKQAPHVNLSPRATGKPRVTEDSIKQQLKKENAKPKKKKNKLEKLYKDILTN